MGKNTVTEEDLLAGVGGGFGSIGQVGSGRPVRDNPFRDTRTERRQSPQPAPPAPAAAPAKEAPPRQTQAAAAETKPRQDVPTPPQPVHAHPAPQPLPEQQDTPARKATPPRLRTPPAPVRQRKTDTYTEKMSTFLSPEMRDELDMAARLLQRNRLVKGERITVHTLIRSGVRVITELLEFTDADVVSSEEELDALVRRKLGVRHGPGK